MARLLTLRSVTPTLNVASRFISKGTTTRPYPAALVSRTYRGAINGVTTSSLCA